MDRINLNGAGAWLEWADLALAAAAAVASAATAVLSRRYFLSLFALWSAGFSVGGIFLLRGAELLAITQWLGSTLICLALLFVRPSLPASPPAEPAAARTAWIGSATRAGSVVLLLGLVLAFWAPDPAEWLASEYSDFADAGGLVAIGRSLGTEFFAAAQITLLILFLAALGASAGAGARPPEERS